MVHYQEVMVVLSESVMKIRLKRPLAAKSRGRHIRLANTSLCRKPCFTDEKLHWITFMKSWSLSNFYEKNSKYYFLKLVSL